MTDNLLEIRGLCAGYGGVNVIDDLSVAVRAGETAALLGLNGSGKSTLLRAALGFVPCSRGEVIAGGQNLHALGERERARLVGYIPQRSRIDEGTTALDAVLMGANAQTPLLGSYTRAQRMRAVQCLERVGAAALGGRTMGTLSFGQRQLVVFARAMMQQPKVYLLDEPDGALDLPRRYEMMAHVRGMVKDGCCALCALHDASLALNAADRVLILKDGRIACELDMRTAQESAVRAAMRLLYGDVKVGRMDGGWAVLG